MISWNESKTASVGGVKWLFLLVGIGLIGLWLYWFPTYTWHQKMTVEVEWNKIIFRGASVVEMTVNGFLEPLQLTGRVRELNKQGEAVVVELPADRYLFALLTYDAYLTGKVFHDLVGGVVTQPEKGWASRIQDVKEVREIALEDYPLLVTFTDIHDPKTVQKVDPENLAATFGPGVSLKRLTLEIADEPMTEGVVDKVVGWLDDPKIMKNPGWRNLPSLTQTAIYGLRKPVQPVK